MQVTDEDEAGMASVAKEYFHELFQAKGSVRTRVLNALRQVITNRTMFILQHLSKWRNSRTRCSRCNQISAQDLMDLIWGSTSIFGNYVVQTFFESVYLG